MDGVIVRQETADDIRAIDVVNISAFQGEDEAQLVTELRKSAAFIPELSLVAEIHNRIVGHVLLFAVSLASAEGDQRILALAPMGVVPSQSHRGIGSALVRASLTKAGSLGYSGIVVIGHPEFYKRFGFKSAAQWNLTCAVPVSDDAVTAFELVKGGFKKGGPIRYPQVFLDLFKSK